MSSDKEIARDYAARRRRELREAVENGDPAAIAKHNAHLEYHRDRRRRQKEARANQDPEALAEQNHRADYMYQYRLRVSEAAKAGDEAAKEKVEREAQRGKRRRAADAACGSVEVRKRKKRAADREASFRRRRARNECRDLIKRALLAPFDFYLVWNLRLSKPGLRRHCPSSTEEKAEVVSVNRELRAAIRELMKQHMRFDDEHGARPLRDKFNECTEFPSTWLDKREGSRCTLKDTRLESYLAKVVAKSQQPPYDGPDFSHVADPGARYFARWHHRDPEGAARMCLKHPYLAAQLRRDVPELFPDPEIPRPSSSHLPPPSISNIHPSSSFSSSSLVSSSHLPPASLPDSSSLADVSSFPPLPSLPLLTAAQLRLVV